MEMTLFGMAIDSRLVQSLKASLPISFTEGGISKDVTSHKEQKARLPMLLIVSGIETDLTL